jgi:hypothetical protein
MFFFFFCPKKKKMADSTPDDAKVAELSYSCPHCKKDIEEFVMHVAEEFLEAYKDGRKMRDRVTHLKYRQRKAAKKSPKKVVVVAEKDGGS